jgi:hypothetical protein
MFSTVFHPALTLRLGVFAVKGVLKWFLGLFKSNMTSYRALIVRGERKERFG